MKSRRISHLLLPVLWMLAAHSEVSGQSRHDFWAFGKELSLDFRNYPPAVVRVGPDTALEGCASISDCKTGQLLFYSNGVTVYNRNHVPMLNGRDLKSDVSSTQSALIVPDPANTERYYLFTTDQAGYVMDESGRLVPHKGMFLHIVDMTGDNGLGELIDRNLPLLPRCAEKLTGIWLKGSNSYWVVTHSLDGDEYNSFKVDKDGVKGPNKSYAGTRFTNAVQYGPGSLVASPNGSMLACLMTNVDLAELLRFDTITGEVQLITELPKVEDVYGAAFSPDNQKLYVNGHGLHQFDLRKPNITDLAKTRYQLAYSGWGALQQGPDGKIYAYGVFGYLGVIQNPNGLKAQCNYDSAAIQVPYGSFGFPNNILGLYDEVCAAPIAIPVTPLEICESKCVTFSDTTIKVTARKWEFQGGTPSTSTKQTETVCYTTPGVYNVKLIASNAEGSDTVTSSVTVRSCPRPVVSLRDTTICVGRCITFDDTSSLSDTRLWTSEGGAGDTTSGKAATICYMKLGTFKVTLIASNEYGYDTASCKVTVIDCDDPVALFTHDTLVCVGDTVLYVDQSLNATSWSWRFGSGTPSASDQQQPGPVIYTKPGTYQTRLIVGNDAEFDTAYSNITVWECGPPITELDSFTICEGDSILFSDATTNYPIQWDWTFDGGSVTGSTLRDPGFVSYKTAGKYPVRLIVSNEYGSDTAFSSVTVRPAAGRPSTASISITDVLSTCSVVDTSVWLRAGCRELDYSLLSSSTPDITVTPTSAVVPADDSVQLRIRITPSTAGTTNAVLFLQLNEDRFGMAVGYTTDASGGLTASQTAIDFGETNICEERDTVVRLTNNGCDTLTITEADIDKNFNVGGSYPIKLAPGESIELSIVTVVDTVGKPRLLTGTLTITSTADNIIPPIALSRSLVYPTRLRLEAVDEASGKQGDFVKFRIILEGDVPSTMTALHFDFLHNNDLLSFEGLTGNNLAITSTTGNESQVQRFTLSTVTAAGILGELTFKAFLAVAEQSTLAFDNITFEAKGVTFAPGCIAVISDTGSRFNFVYTCGDNIIRDQMNGTRLIKSITPNPANDEIRIELADGISNAEVTIVDMLGTEVLHATGERIDIRTLPSGTYYLRVTAGGASQTKRIVIDR
jgi:PKD repeat protein